MSNSAGASGCDTDTGRTTSTTPDR
jgi:hypothetical protein